MADCCQRRLGESSRSYYMLGGGPAPAPQVCRTLYVVFPHGRKNFCWDVGSVPWKKVVNAKENMNVFDRVIQWDDSAGEEAFRRAKLRYWSKMINRRPCRIPLPSPDMFIDKVDRNPNNVDYELLQDLDEACSEDEDQEEQKENAVMNSFDIPIDQIKPTGWDCDYI